MLRLLTVILALFAACTLLVGGARALARRDPPPQVAAVLPDNACRAPCWQGLRPGYTPPEMLAAWLDDPPLGGTPRRLDAGMPDLRDHWRIALPGAPPLDVLFERTHAAWLDDLTLSAPGLSLGDLLAALGPPDAISFTLAGNRSTLTLNYRAHYLAHNLVAAGTLPDARRLSPTTAVEQIEYPAARLARPVLALDWRGFADLTRYYPHGLTAP